MLSKNGVSMVFQSFELLMVHNCFGSGHYMVHYIFQGALGINLKNILIQEYKKFSSPINQL